MTVRIYADEDNRRIRGISPELNAGNRLMFITHRTAEHTEYDEVDKVLKGGCRWIQLRMKEGIDPKVAQAISSLCQASDGEAATLCIDDDIRAALAHQATALHLGKNDLPLSEAWEILDRELAPDRPFFVGATANTFADIERAVREGASYIGLGPYRFTETKKRLSPILGIEGYRTIMQQCRAAGYTLPVFAIGGIELEDVRALMQTGISGIAVSGAIINAPDPTEMTRRFIREINISLQ